MSLDFGDAIGACLEAIGIALDSKPKKKVFKICYWTVLIVTTIAFYVFINRIISIDIIYVIPVLFGCFILALIAYGILCAVIVFCVILGYICIGIIKGLFKLLFKICSLFV